MSKTSRNDPCPCGSGKKYKKCCIDKILSFPKANDFDGEELKNSGQFLEMIKNEFEMGEYNSLDEMNEKLSHFTRNHNEIPKSPFLGLSPSQMHEVLNSPFCLDNSLFKFEPSSDKELLEVPLVKQSLYLLNKLKDVGELKATQKGNLPKAFVIELYEEFFTKERYSRKPNKEDDLPQVTLLKHLLDLAGLIKKRKGKISLTKKGLSILDNNKTLDLFKVIFMTYTNKLSWSYSDGYPEFFLIQRSITFNLLLLFKKCEGWTLNKELGQFYIDAFPSLLNETSDTYYSSPEGQIINAFSIRFLSRFCVPLGLLEFKEEKKKDWKYYKFLEYFKPTGFFKSNFNFNI